MVHEHVVLVCFNMDRPAGNTCEGVVLIVVSAIEFHPVRVVDDDGVSSQLVPIICVDLHPQAASTGGLSRVYERSQ